MCLTIATAFTVTTVPYQLTQYVLVYGNLEHAHVLDGVVVTKIMTFFYNCVHVGLDFAAVMGRSAGWLAGLSGKRLVS